MQETRRGRPVGIARDGVYGRGVKTVPVRVPEDKKELVQRLIVDLPELVSRWKQASKNTRDWTQANKLLEELESLILE